MSEITVQREGPVAVVALTGEHDLATVGRFDATVADVLNGGATSCMVDLSGLTFCDSFVVHSLVSWSKEAQVSEREALAIVVGSEDSPISRILAIVGLLGRLPVFASPQAAWLSLLDGRRPRPERPLGWLTDRELRDARATALREVQDAGGTDASQDAAIHRLSDIVREQQRRHPDAAR